jgi:hypothetical protein
VAVKYFCDRCGDGFHQQAEYIYIWEAENFYHWVEAEKECFLCLMCVKEFRFGLKKFFDKFMKCN